MPDRSRPPASCRNAGFFPSDAQVSQDFVDSGNAECAATVTGTPAKGQPTDVSHVREQVQLETLARIVVGEWQGSRLSPPMVRQAESSYLIVLFAHCVECKHWVEL